MNYDPKNQPYIAALEQFRTSLANLHAQWTLETVKHLALINIAGMAGTTALLQASQWQAPLLFRWSLIFFFLGLILAVIDFHLNSVAFGIKLKDADRARINLLQSESRGEMERHGVPDNSAGMLWFTWAAAAGWLSAIFAVVGCVLIGVQLFE